MSAPRASTAADVALAAMLAALVAALSAWILTRGGRTLEPFHDYRFHNQIAGRMAAGGPLEVPHPLYHLLVAGLDAVAPALDRPRAGLAVAVSAQVALALLAFLALKWVAPQSSTVPALLALGLTVVAPLNWLTPGPREFYFGYIYATSFHSPTMLLLRPLALGLFLATVAAIDKRDGHQGMREAGLAVLTLSSALAKPSYVMCLVPAVIILLLGEWRRLSRPPDSCRLLVVGAVLPGLIVMVAQAWFTLSSPQMKPSRVVWAPLQVVFHHTHPDVALVAAKLLLSIAFPLVVAAAFWRQAARDPGLRLAWLGLAAGAAYAYGLAETGARAAHGNFIWSGQAAAAVLFIASARFLLDAWARSRDASGDRVRMAACGIAFVLHVAAGLQNAARFVRDGDRFFQ
jgi:hypothetical protein